MFRVYREKNNIDIIARSDEDKIMLIIENKIFSPEGGNQLKRYRKLIEGNKTFGGYLKLFIFLTPEGIEPSDNNWLPFDYLEIIELISNDLLKQIKKQRVKSFLKQYVEMLYGNVVSKHRYIDAAENICRSYPDIISNLNQNSENYKQQIRLSSIDKKVIDYLISIQSGKSLKLIDHFKNIIAELGLVIFPSGKRCIRFLTRTSEEHLRKSVPFNGFQYFFEIVDDGSSISLELIINKKACKVELTDKYLDLTSSEPDTFSYFQIDGELISIVKHDIINSREMKKMEPDVIIIKFRTRFNNFIINNMDDIEELLMDVDNL